MPNYGNGFYGFQNQQNYYGQQPNMPPGYNGEQNGMQYQPQPQPQPQYQNNNPMPQSVVMPLVYVNGVEGAKSYIVFPNRTVYLRDADNNILYEKQSDYQGKCKLIAYTMTPIEIDNIGKPIETINKELSYATKEDLKGLVNKDDLKAFQDELSESVRKLSSTLENALKKGKSNVQG